ncbi:MAG: dTDP-4-dehydrorhamnose reductase [Flaviaesturariibacter sp.]|nr:dTDP-4-dehydrorhamnose reductase [Flaviaesturariibacter sp.]
MQYCQPLVTALTPLLINMRVLVTGANGQLGQELQALQNSHTNIDFTFLSRTELDISDSDAVQKYFSELVPDYCINCAAYTAVDKAEGEEAAAYRINAAGTQHLALACKSFNTRFIHISTDYVFDGNGTTPYVEESPISPIGIYGASKREGERLAQEVNDDAVIIRTSWVFSSFGSNFVKTMLRLMPAKESLNVVNDQRGCPTYAADLASAILQIISEGKWTPGIFHFSNAKETTWFEFATAIKAHCQFTCTVDPITTDQYPTPAKRPAYSVLDTKKISATYGITIRDWQTSLADCLAKLKCAV